MFFFMFLWGPCSAVPRDHTLTQQVSPEPSPLHSDTPHPHQASTPAGAADTRPHAASPRLWPALRSPGHRLHCLPGSPTLAAHAPWVTVHFLLSCTPALRLPVLVSASLFTRSQAMHLPTGLCPSSLGLPRHVVHVTCGPQQATLRVGAGCYFLPALTLPVRLTRCRGQRRG